MRLAAMPSPIETGHTDIVAGGWVSRLPLGWQPYALLARLAKERKAIETALADPGADAVKTLGASKIWLP